ncbi:hypothetical protein K523DRAFT_145457 [Schizophyllum commune Tattone D]|nr:hypothetical protein K523DRAFT_145457 [Schizophyllum commune Tattone D]
MLERLGPQIERAEDHCVARLPPTTTSSRVRLNKFNMNRIAFPAARSSTRLRQAKLGAEGSSRSGFAASQYTRPCWDPALRTGGLRNSPIAVKSRGDRAAILSQPRVSQAIDCTPTSRLRNVWAGGPRTNSNQRRYSSNEALVIFSVSPDDDSWRAEGKA